jgi:hypothetical protein
VLGRRYLVWRVRIAGFGFNSGPTYPIGCQNFQRPAPSSDLENIILVTTSSDLTQQKKYKCQRTGWFELRTQNFWFFDSDFFFPNT